MRFSKSLSLVLFLALIPLKAVADAPIYKIADFKEIDGYLKSEKILYMVGLGIDTPDSVHEPQLWRTDGTPEGTFKIGDNVGLIGQKNLDKPDGFAAVNGNSLYWKYRDDHLPEAAIWGTDGTVAGTAQLATGHFMELYAFNKGVATLRFYDDHTDSTHLEFYKVGTAGPVFVDTALEIGGCDYESSLGDKIFLECWTRDPATGNFSQRFILSDGTEAGTKVFSNADGVAYGTIAVGSRVYFANHIGGSMSLWKLNDGDAAPTKLGDLGPTIYEPVFTGYSGGVLVSYGADLFVSDGTVAGTKKLYTFSGANPLLKIALRTLGTSVAISRGGGNLFRLDLGAMAPYEIPVIPDWFPDVAGINGHFVFTAWDEGLASNSGNGADQILKYTNAALPGSYYQDTPNGYRSIMEAKAAGGKFYFSAGCGIIGAGATFEGNHSCLFSCSGTGGVDLVFAGQSNHPTPDDYTEFTDLHEADSQLVFINGSPLYDIGGYPSLYGVDSCPSDPLKVKPGSCGCGISDADTNNNGIADCHESPLLFPPADPVLTLAPKRKVAIQMAVFAKGKYQIEISWRTAKGKQNVKKIGTKKTLNTVKLSPAVYSIRYRVTVGKVTTPFSASKSIEVKK